MMKNESTPPPKIGKIGPYTVFITPINNGTREPVPGSPITRPPPVQAPPMQIPNNNSTHSSSSFGFFWDALSKLQNAHANLDEKISYWFGLDQSKYQWALDEYYESKGTVSTIPRPLYRKSYNCLIVLYYSS
ncbi:hypothetical protein Leryth_012801 [Lithospermum erythrorhizon]|nr:hypothetical protein Leryth_012801 [Lithospermum erythrorhizon]